MTSFPAFSMFFLCKQSLPMITRDITRDKNKNKITRLAIEDMDFIFRVKIQSTNFDIFNKIQPKTINLSTRLWGIIQNLLGLFPRASC